MRLRLTLQILPNSTLHINYAYALQAVVYKVLASANPELSAWLHDQGFELSGKRFKFFTFGPLQGKPFTINRHNQTITYHTDQLSWDIAFAVPAHIETFISGIFNNRMLEVAVQQTKLRFQVESVAVLPSPKWQTTMRYRAVHPICIATKIAESRHPEYLSPEAEPFERIFLNNLEHKLAALTFEWPFMAQSALNPSLRVLSPPKKRKFDHFKKEAYQSTSIIGYEFDFELTAPIAHQAMGFFAGFGSYNTSGFGFARVIE